MPDGFKIKLAFDDGKVIFANAALGAFPVVGNILELGARRDAAVGVADFRIIDPATYITNVFFHINTP
jgi:hypothetical protein